MVKCSVCGGELHQVGIDWDHLVVYAGCEDCKNITQFDADYHNLFSVGMHAA